MSDRIDLRDKGILDRNIDQKWIPKNPIEFVTPYIEEIKKDSSSIEAKKEKAHKVYEEYERMEIQSKELCGIIEEECKNVSVSLATNDNLKTIEAIRRLFGTEGNTITFEMYKLAVQELAALNNKSLIVT